ncbi:ABC transporter ATP-binding protein [Ignavibacteria bacterium]|nr:ABC transporter ATP-binding protein [Bacteroidota bacterium]MCZ2132835.1 ABC transporter ATP-binding protein/permease [Bacteroidota bacterium]
MRSLTRLFPYLKQHKIRLISGLLFVTISNICSTTVPRFVGSTIDGFNNPNFGMDHVVGNIVYILLLTAGSGFFMFLTRQTVIVASRLIEYDLRNDLLMAVERQDTSFFHKYSTGSLMAHTTNDISAAREFLGPAIMYSANSATTFIFAVVNMIFLSPIITLVSLAPLPIMAYATYRIGKRVHIAFRNVQEQFGEVTAIAQESFSGIRVSKAYNSTDREAEQFASASKEYAVRSLKLARYQSFMMPSMMFLIGLSNMLVLGFGGLQAIQGNATVGVITQFFIYLNQLMWPVAAIGWVTNLVQRASASMGRIAAIFDTIPNIRDDKSVVKDTKIHGDIEFRNVSFRYQGARHNALSDIFLKIPVGCSLGIVGATGSGKTTLVNLIPRMFDPTSGNILIDGKQSAEIPLDTLRRGIGIVTQEPFLFSESIEDNIRAGNPAATEADIIAAAKAARLHDDIVTFPDGYKTVVGERGVTLSGGQKQRTAIARALLRNPAILILDDALSAVDTATEHEILKYLHEAVKNCAALIVSHRLSATQNCDAVVVLDEGRIAEYGSHEELLKIPDGIYSELWEIQRLEEELQRS